MTYGTQIRISRRYVTERGGDGVSHVDLASHQVAMVRVAMVDYAALNRGDHPHLDKQADAIVKLLTPLTEDKSEPVEVDIYTLDQIMDAARSLFSPDDLWEGPDQYARGVCELIGRLRLDHGGMGEGTAENAIEAADDLGIANPYMTLTDDQSKPASTWVDAWAAMMEVATPQPWQLLAHKLLRELNSGSFSLTRAEAIAYKINNLSAKDAVEAWKMVGKANSNAFVLNAFIKFCDRPDVWSIMIGAKL